MRNQNHNARGNWREVVSHLLEKRSLISQSTSELKELHKDAILKDEERMGKVKEVLEKWRHGSRPRSIREALEKQKIL